MSSSASVAWTQVVKLSDRSIFGHSHANLGTSWLNLTSSGDNASKVSRVFPHDPRDLQGAREADKDRHRITLSCKVWLPRGVVAVARSTLLHTLQGRSRMHAIHAIVVHT